MRETAGKATDKRKENFQEEATRMMDQFDQHMNRRLTPAGINMTRIQMLSMRSQSSSQGCPEAGTKVQ